MLQFIALNDWIGVYDKAGNLLFQGHSIEETELCDLLDIPYDWKYLDDYPDSRLPKTLKELESND